MKAEPRFERLHRMAEQGAAALARKHVAVFGLGGVGGIACEALCRSGVGRLTLVDGDVVDISNMNRQIIATDAWLGRPKTEAMARRIVDINPLAQVTCACRFYGRDDWEPDWAEFDYVLDAIDDVPGKLRIIAACRAHGVPVISSMGAGNRLDPSAFAVMDIAQTSMDPLARVMRKKLRDIGVEKGVQVVCSTEKPLPVQGGAPGSFMPAVGAAGLCLAGACLRALMTLPPT